RGLSRVPQFQPRESTPRGDAVRGARAIAWPTGYVPGLESEGPACQTRRAGALALDAYYGQANRHDQSRRRGYRDPHAVRPEASLVHVGTDGRRPDGGARYPELGPGPGAQDPWRFGDCL